MMIHFAECCIWHPSGLLVIGMPDTRIGILCSVSWRSCSLREMLADPPWNSIPERFGWHSRRLRRAYHPSSRDWVGQGVSAPRMYVDFVPFLILSKNAYTKFSAVPIGVGKLLFFPGSSRFSSQKQKDPHLSCADKCGSLTDWNQRDNTPVVPLVIHSRLS